MRIGIELIDFHDSSNLIVILTDLNFIVVRHLIRYFDNFATSIDGLDNFIDFDNLPVADFVDLINLLLYIFIDFDNLMI
jgi:hypothetical protein